MASQTHKNAEKKRKSAERKRAAAQKIINDPNKSAAQKAAARQRRDANAATMRAQGNIMRAETGREKGQRTTYTGPISVEGRKSRNLPQETEWQKVNLKWLQDIQAENPNWTITQARNELKRMFADDRPGYLTEQQRRMDAEETVEFPSPEVVTTVDPPGVRGPGVGGPGVGGPFGPGGRMPAGYGGYGRGAAAQDAAQGWAGMLGFNIDPRGGLLLRPWEQQSWELAGIDPNLWNPQSGLLGGPSQYTQPGGRPPVDWTTLPPILPEPGTQPGTTTTPTNPFAVDPNKWTPPHGFVVDPIKEAGGQSPFMQWTIAQHAKNQAANAANWANPDALVANRPGEPIGPSQTYVSPPGPHRNLPAVTTAQVPLTVGSTTDPVSGRQTHGFDPTTGQVFNQGWRNWMDTNPLQGYVQGMDRVGDISAATSEGLLGTDIWT